ncbi:MAG: glycosyltransferase [Desulfobacteraceae bacterium]|nr:glycosyltransferase [Desulfobacteraceae bacterium]MBC2749214.1 glycosyltransferase [Desulfobacteraceae bacterium]
MISIVHVIDGLGWAGMEHMVASLVRCIDKKRFKVTLLSEIPMRDSVVEQAAFLEKEGVRVRFLQKHHRKKFLAIEYARFFNDLKPQVVHSHSGVWRDSCIGAVLAKVPLLFHTEHGRVFLDDNRRTRLTHRILTQFRSGIISVSDELRQFLIEEVHLPVAKVITIQNGIDTDKYMPGNYKSRLRDELGISPETVIVMAVGRINPVKDYETLVHAVSLVKHFLPNNMEFKTVIVGPETRDHLTGGGLLDRLRELSRKFNVEKNLIFLGKRTDVQELLRVADIFVQTSLTEGLSMSIMEAMSTALPTVVTDVGGNRELVEHRVTGFLTHRKDPESIANALLKLIEDDEMRVSMGKKARNCIVEKFSLQAMTKKYEDLYMESLRE